MRQITGSPSKGRKKRYEYYHCRHKCPTRVPVDKANDFVSALLTDLQINNNVKELFADILKDTDIKYYGDKARQLVIKQEKQRVIKESPIEAENMLLKRELTSDRFNSIASRLNNDLMTINTDIELLSTKDDSIKEYVDTGLEMLANLNLLFLESDYEGKRITVGSLFTKKLICGNGGCRTTEINEVLEVLIRSSKGFEASEKEKAAKNDSLFFVYPMGWIYRTF